MTITGAIRNTALTMQEYGWEKEFDSERVAQNNLYLVVEACELNKVVEPLGQSYV